MSIVGLLCHYAAIQSTALKSAKSWKQDAIKCISLFICKKLHLKKYKLKHQMMGENFATHKKQSYYICYNT